MPGTKAKARPIKAAAKAPKGPQNPKAAKPARAAPKSAAKQAEPSGPLSSLKKMLGIGGAKGAPAPKGAAGKQPVAPPAVAPQGKRGGKAAVAAPAPGKPGAAPAKGGRGKNKFVSDIPKTELETSLRPAKKEASDALPPGAPVCREVACELMATTGGYCRMHYIKNWKKIKRKEIILREKKLNHYIEELVSKYPDKYIEAIRQDLASEKDFAKVIADLEIDEALDDFESVETEGAEGLIDNLKRDFDDDGDVF